MLLIVDKKDLVALSSECPKLKDIIDKSSIYLDGFTKDDAMEGIQRCLRCYDGFDKMSANNFYEMSHIVFNEILCDIQGFFSDYTVSEGCVDLDKAIYDAIEKRFGKPKEYK